MSRGRWGLTAVGTARLPDAEEGDSLDPLLLAPPPPRPPCLGALPVAPPGSALTQWTQAELARTSPPGKCAPVTPAWLAPFASFRARPAEPQDPRCLLPDHVPTAPGLSRASGDSSTLPCPLAFRYLGSVGAGRAKPRVGGSLPGRHLGRVGSHPQARVTCLPQPGTPASEPSPPPLRFLPRWPAVASCGAAVQRDPLPLLVPPGPSHLRDQAFVLSDCVWEELVPFLICCGTQSHDVGRVGSSHLLAGAAELSEGRRQGPATAQSSGR